MFQPYVRNVPSGRSMQLASAGSDPGQYSFSDRLGVIVPMAFQLDWGALDGSEDGVNFWLYTPYYTRVERATLVGTPKFDCPDVSAQFVQQDEDGVIELTAATQIAELSTDPFQLPLPGSMQVLPLYLRVRGPSVSGKTALLTLHLINSENQ